MQNTDFIHLSQTSLNEVDLCRKTSNTTVARMSAVLEAASGHDDDSVFPKPICLSFSGCGFLGLYHVGVAICINEHRHLLKIEKVGGASAGALTGANLLCGGDFGEVILELFEVATRARSGWLGPFSPNFNIVEHVRDGLRRFLPADAHKICSGRLFISMTRVSDAVNVVVSQYTSREDLIQALICSSFVPVFSGIVPPLFRGRRYWDGGITDNLPKFDAETVTVSPFSGVSSICPEEAQSLVNFDVVNQSFKWSTSNFNRLSRALFPPNPESLRQLVREGYRDALKFVQKITAYIPDEPTPLNEEEQEYFRKKQARQIKRENAAQRVMAKKSVVLENVPAKKIQKSQQPQPMSEIPTATTNDQQTRAAAAAQRAADMDVESGVASSTDDEALEQQPERPSMHVSSINDAAKIVDAAAALAERGEPNVTKLRNASPYELNILSRRPSLRSLGPVVDADRAANDAGNALPEMQKKNSLVRTHSADDIRLLMSSIRRSASQEVEDNDEATSDDEEYGGGRRRRHRYVPEMPNYLSNALQEACIQDFLSENPYQSNFTILPIPWMLPLELTYSIILSMIEAVPNRSAKWWKSRSERSYTKRCLLMLRNTLGVVIGQLVRSHDQDGSAAVTAVSGVALTDAAAAADAVHQQQEETQRRREQRFLHNVFGHLRHHAPAPVAFVVNKSVGVASRAVSRSTRVGRKAASYAFGLDRYNTDDDYDYDSDDEFTSCGTDSEAHFTVVSKKANQRRTDNMPTTSVSEDEVCARQQHETHAMLNLDERQAVATLLGASEYYTSPPPSALPPQQQQKSSGATSDQWFDYDTAYDRDYSRPCFSGSTEVVSAAASSLVQPPPTIIEEDEESIASASLYSPRAPRSSSRLGAAMLSTPVSPSMQRKAVGTCKSSPASPRKVSYADGSTSSSSSAAAAATAAAAAAKLQAATQNRARNGQHGLSSSIRSLNVAGIDDMYGVTSFTRSQPTKRARTAMPATSASAAEAANLSAERKTTNVPAVAMDETDFAGAAQSVPGGKARWHVNSAFAARRKTKADTDIEADDEAADDVDERPSTPGTDAPAPIAPFAADSVENQGKIRSSLSTLNKTFASLVNALYSNTTSHHGSN